MRYRAKVAYDGTAYHGFQRQVNAPSVQGELEAALARISGAECSVIGSGRTDAGVHASGQVIAFDLDWRHSPENLQSALNVNLRNDIAVVEVTESAANFHPRYDAISRTYQYRLYVTKVADPLRRLYTWQMPYPLEVAAMREAAICLLGTHDFSSFGSPPQGDNSVRTVFRADWQTAANEYYLTVTANAFLFRMVRRIVGTLVMVGQGRMTPAEFRDILAARDRRLASPPAPPQGLTLTAVDYRKQS